MQYYPQEPDGEFGGVMKVLDDGLFYVISRSFVQQEEQLTVMKLSDQSYLPNPQEWIQKSMRSEDFQTYQENGFLSESDFIQAMYDSKSQAVKENEALLEYENTLASLAEKKKGLAAKEKSLSSQAELEALKQEEAYLLSQKKEREAELEKVNSLYTVSSMEHVRKLQQKSFQIQKEVKKLKHELLSVKEELNQYANIPEKGLASRNFFAICFLVIGILSGLVAYFIYSSQRYEVLDYTDINQLLFWILIGVGVVFFIAGVVLAICFAVEKGKVVKRYKEREALYEKACKIESAYEETLRRAASVNVDAQNKVLEAEKDAHAKDTLELMSVISSIGDRLEAIAKKKENFSSSSADELNAIQAEIVSVDMSIDSIQKMLEAEKQAQEEKKTPATPMELLMRHVEKLNQIDRRRSFPLILDETLDRFVDKEREELLSYLRNIGRQVLLLTEQKRS